MIDHVGNRDTIIRELREELVGPAPGGKPIDVNGTVHFDELQQANGPWYQMATGEEILVRDTPTKRYGVGVLFPRNAQLNDVGEFDNGDDVAMDDDLRGASDVIPSNVALDEELDRDTQLTGEAETDDLDLSLANVYQPSVMGVSFLVELPPGSRLLVEANNCGRYVRKKVTIGRQEEHPRQRTWWLRQRVDLREEFDRNEILGTSRIIRRRAEWRGPGERGDLDLWFELYVREHGSHHDQRLVTVCLVNRTEAPLRGNPSEYCLFQAGFTVTVCSPDSSALVLPYPGIRPGDDPEEESIALLYRNLQTFATGHGCSADWVRSPSDPERAVSVKAECLPFVEVPNTTADITDESGQPVTVDMAALAGLRSGEDGVAQMERVINLYEQWLARQSVAIDMLPIGYRDAARRHLDACWHAARRMRDGLDYLKSDACARRAFQLANHAVLLQQINSARGVRNVEFDQKTQRLTFDPPYRPPDPLHPSRGRGTWRAFQIGFLLSCLRSAVEGDDPERETIELIWFPTGGGKTEAYLGLSAFAMFKRRLDDPNDVGVHVLMRYTLRLLTAQQFQRAAALLCAMEYLRRNRDELGTAPFQAGIWVGGDATPNTRLAAVRELQELRNGYGGGKNGFLLTWCPWCGARFRRLEIRRGRRGGQGPVLTPGYKRQPTPDGRAETVVFACPDPACPFNTQLPIIVVDEDIYEQRPTLVLGTIDKFAMLAWRPEARSLFGLGADGQRVASPPGLIIQDELHLISGPVGSMAALYETVVEDLCTDRRTGKVVPPKIVCATATIRRFAHQAKALYGRERTALFPPPELEAGQSFFAREQRPGRVYLGVHAPSLGSVQTEWVRTFTALLLAPMRLEGNEARDPWWTLVAFFNSLREMGTAHTLFDTDVRDYANVIWARKGVPFDASRRRLSSPFELTGGLPSEEIVNAIEMLEIPCGRAGALDVCLASSVIEVGIDIQRLGLIVVAGQPKSTSQYIQVTGRVGRDPSKPGLVVTMYSPSKPRDRSHFERFRSYHEQLYAHVEPTSVTPFAMPAMERALHAVMTAYARLTGGREVADRPYPFPEQVVAEFSNLAMDRVRIVDSAEEGALRAVLERRQREWRDWQRTRWVAARGDKDIGQLRFAGAYATPEEQRFSWETPTSMRNVDRECEMVITQLYLWEGDANE